MIEEICKSCALRWVAIERAINICPEEEAGKEGNKQIVIGLIFTNTNIKAMLWGKLSN